MAPGWLGNVVALLLMAAILWIVFRLTSPGARKMNDSHEAADEIERLMKQIETLKSEISNLERRSPW